MRCLLAFITAVSSCLVKAADTAIESATPAKTVASLPGVGQVVISLALVIGLVLMLAAIYRKVQLKLPGSQHFKIVSSVSVGPKERILVIEIQGKQRVIGVTPHSVNFLFDLDSPLPTEKFGIRFSYTAADLLKEMMWWYGSSPNLGVAVS